MMTKSLLVIVAWLLGFVLSGIIGKYCGAPKGNQRVGFWLGFFLGPLGWILAALIGPSGPKCPACGAGTVPGARKCCHCGEVLTTPKKGWNR